MKRSSCRFGMVSGVGLGIRVLDGGSGAPRVRGDALFPNVKGEGLLKVTDSHEHWKSDNISETVLGRDVVITGH